MNICILQDILPIHSEGGAQEVFPDRLLLRTSEQAVEMILDDEYDSRSYRQWVESKFSAADQHRQVDNTLAACVDTGTGRTRISYWARAIALLGSRTADGLGRVLFTTLHAG